MPSITLGGKSVVTQTTPNQPTIANNVQFPAGHVIQTKFNQIAAFSSSESLSGTTSKTVRAKSAITIGAGNSIMIGLSIDEIQPSVVTGEYMSLVMNASTSDPGSTVNTTTTGSNLFYPVPGGGFGNLDLSIGYYASSTSTRYNGLHFVTALNNPGAGTYYIWFIAFNAGSVSTTFHIGVNGQTKMEIREITGSLS